MRSPRAIRKMAKPLAKSVVKGSRKIDPFKKRSVGKAQSWMKTNIIQNKYVRTAIGIEKKLMKKKKN